MSLREKLEKLRKKDGKIRDLAFCKENKGIFTEDEYRNVLEFVGEKDNYEYYGHFWIYCETGGGYSDWSNQKQDINFKNCKKVVYEDLFKEPTKTLKEELEKLRNSKGEIRNLAFYSDSEWTQEKYIRLCEFVGCVSDDDCIYGNDRYIFDDGSIDFWFYNWNTVDDINFKNCKEVKYEDLFKDISPNLKPTPTKKYKESKIPKKRKGFRTICIPSKELKTSQRGMLKQLYTYFNNLESPNKNLLHGFLKNKSPVTCAKEHIGFKSTIMMDISNFFDSIHKDNKAFKPIKDYKNFDECFTIDDERTAQGFITSPMLANISLVPILDVLMPILVDYHKDLDISFKLTIYADDIQLSTNTENHEDINNLIEIVSNVFNDFGLSINKSKTRIRYAKYGFRRILGINVGDKTTQATRKIMRKIRASKHQSNNSSLGGLTNWKNQSNN